VACYRYLEDEELRLRVKNAKEYLQQYVKTCRIIKRAAKRAAVAWNTVVQFLGMTILSNKPQGQASSET